MVATFVLIIAFDDLRRERILAYLDPWNPKYAQGKAYQLTHSLIAFGRGEMVRPGPGLQRREAALPARGAHRLPARRDRRGTGLRRRGGGDRAFFWLTRRIFVIGRQAIALDRVFAGLMAQGIGIWIGFQAFINMGVNLGVLPTKGLTLPLMSYGGSAILMNLVALALVLRVDIENRAEASCAEGSSGGRMTHHLVTSWPQAPAGTSSRAGRGARDAAPRLERQLAGHQRTAWRTSSCRRRHPAGHASASAACAARACCTPPPAACACCKAFWECLRHPAPARRRRVLGMGGYVCFPGGPDGQRC
jgi:hypothetical protein